MLYLAIGICCLGGDRTSINRILITPIILQRTLAVNFGTCRELPPPETMSLHV